jgi:hypothetical protein
MNEVILLLLLLSHVLADFVIQSAAILNDRFADNSARRLSGNVKHACIHLAVVLVFLGIYFPTVWVVPVALLITALHFIIDLIKSGKIVHNKHLKYNLYAFLLDQSIHVALIVFVAYLSGIILYFSEPSSALPGEDFILAVLLIVTGLWGVGIFIPIFFNHIKISALNKPDIEYSTYPEGTKSSGAPKGGFIIGILERVIIITAL